MPENLKLPLHVLSRKGPIKHVKNTNYNKQAKVRAVAKYLETGNMMLVSKMLEIEYGLLRKWKMQPWWSEYERELRNTANLVLDNKLTEIVEASLVQALDRVTNGDEVYNQKTGQMVRKKMGGKDVAKVANDLLTKRELLRGNATSRTEATAVPVQDQLALLAQEFARMVSGKPADVFDVEMVEVIRGDTDDVMEELMNEDEDAFYEERQEGLQEGSSPVHLEAGSGEEADGTERSTTENDQSRESP